MYSGGGRSGSPSGDRLGLPLRLDGGRFVDLFGFGKSLTGRFAHLANLAAHRTIWLEPQIGIQLLQQASIVVFPPMDFCQQKVAQRTIRPAQNGVTSASLALF